MATIKNNSIDADGLGVDPISKAARTSLWEDGGDRLSKADGTFANNVTDEALLICSVNDGNIRHIRSDRLGNIGIASNTSLFSDSFEGGSLATNRWTFVQSTMTVTQTAAAGIRLNSANITTANTGCFVRTLRTFRKMQRAPLHAKARVSVTSETGSVSEFGFGEFTTFNGANTNGAYFQYTSGGAIQGVLTFNGVDLTTAPITSLSGSNFYTWDIILDDNSVQFFVQDTQTGQVISERTIFLPTTQAKLWSSTRLFFFARTYNTASGPSVAPSVILSSLDILTTDLNPEISIGEALAAEGYGAHIQPATFAPTVNWTNSAAPTNATLSNTAAGYTTLGGWFSFAAVAGATTDYALFGFQVPSPYSFLCTDVSIESFVAGAAVAGTSTTLVWALGINQPALTLATTGIYRVPLGVQSFDVGTAIGKTTNRIAEAFRVPLVTNPGRFMTVILRMPVATATPSQLVQGLVTIKGYFQ